MATNGSSLPNLLQERASREPDATAFTFIDYEMDPTGFVEKLTWSQVYRRALIVAEELRLCGSVGDRAAILAPQGLDYIVAFLGALQAGFIAVPLSVPVFGTHDERVSSVIRDCSPVVILTTTSVVDDVTECARADRGQAVPSVMVVDSLDLDSLRELDPTRYSHPSTAYLQYTSGSTRTPAGVVVSHKNVMANLEQGLSDYFEDPEMVWSGTVVSWLPFWHDMGLILGICAPLTAGRSPVLLSPLSFLQRPARWMQLLATNYRAFSGAPNFAFELAVRRTSDEDMAGLDLGDVRAIISGSERIHAATVRRFYERFTQFNLNKPVIRPSYGLAEATVYVATPGPARPLETVHFEYEQLSAGQAKRCGSDAEGSIEHVSYGEPRTSIVRIVDPDTQTENPAGKIGEIWVHGNNVAMGYWRKPELTARTFGAKLVSPSPGTPEGPWLRTGDLGVISDGELFIIGRLKDLLIIAGRNHYPEDIEATIHEITAGRVAAISVPDDRAEQLVAIIELKQPGGSDEENIVKLRSVKHKVSSAIFKSHGLRVSDLVLVPRGSIPITTSGKVRRSACLERYRHQEFSRLDISA